MQKNRKKIAIIAVAAVFGLLAVLAFLFGTVTEDLTENVNYRQNNNGGKITNDTAITQTFLCRQDHVKGLMLRVSTFGQTFQEGNAVFTLLDEKGTQLAREAIALSTLKDKGAVSFYFDTLSGVKGKVLTLKAEGENLPDEMAYSLMIGQGSVGGMLTTADGKTTENNSLFMTMTYEETYYAVNAIVVFAAIMVICLSLLPMCKKEEL